MFSEIADRELLEVATRLAQAERTKDIAILRTLIAEEYVGVGASGEVLTKEIVLARFSDPNLEFEHHEVSDIQVRTLESVGLILGAVSLRGTMAAQVFEGQFRFMDVCVKRAGQWWIVASQLTPCHGGSQIGELFSM